MTVAYEYDMDPRYGWASIDVGNVSEPLIVVHGKSGSFGFTFRDGQMVPTCICYAYEASECACPNVSWGECP